MKISTTIESNVGRYFPNTHSEISLIKNLIDFSSVCERTDCFVFGKGNFKDDDERQDQRDGFLYHFLRAVF